MTPKLAHLFLIREGLNHEIVWERFFLHHEETYSLYVHAKWPNSVKSRWLQRNLIEDHCDTEWGSVSIVQAELQLLKAALRTKDNRFFLLHSESCVPLRPFGEIYEELFRIDRSWIHYHRGNMRRYQGVNQAVIPKRHFLKSSQFFCLTRAHAELLVKRLDLNNWKECYCADEHCVASTLSEYGELDKCVKRDLTFAHWPQQSRSPITFSNLSYSELKLFRTTPALFARKFAIDSDIANFIPISNQTGSRSRRTSHRSPIAFGPLGYTCQ